MTFEEFFIRKKIDLNRLRHANPALYDEFREHYHQMGEKSFDHTKKYWFNRLRKDYLLEAGELVDTLPKPGAKPAEKGVSSTLNTVPVKPTGFKPRFKAATTDQSATDTPGIPEKKATSPTGFKPRFKTAVKSAAPPTDSKNTGETTVAKSSSEQEETPALPENSQKPLGFKPRFKSGVTPAIKKEHSDPAPDMPEKTPEKENEQPAKPLGFRPRFKSGATSATPVKKEDSEPATNTPEETPEKENKQTTKSLGFKPRFKPDVTPTAPTKQEDPDPRPDMPEKSSEKDNEQPAKPLGFKPRFKPGATKPKKD